MALPGLASLFPFPFSPSRNAFTPQITLSYNSGSGNGIFGLGWSAGQPVISRKTDKQLPLYHDADESDTFIFSGAEDMVPVYIQDGTGNWIQDTQFLNGTNITAYRPRIEGSFSRIEKITEASGYTYWQVATRDNVVSIFGKSSLAQIYDTADASKIFKWLPEFSYDDKGNCLQYQYKKEDKVNLPAFPHERNRMNGSAAYSNSYLKSVRYGNQLHFNRASIDLVNWVNFLNTIDYLLELVIGYCEHNQDNPQPTDDLGWAYCSDAFSDYRSGFEIHLSHLQPFINVPRAACESICWFIFLKRKAM